MATYRAARRQWAAEVLEQHASPDDWAAFKAAVRTLRTSKQAGAFLDWLRASWLPAAHPDVRALALREIAHCADAIRVEQGHEPLADPLPHEPASLFIRCRDILRVR
jgi:hypothetical protein